MGQCRKVVEGARCKRRTPKGSLYCADHDHQREMYRPGRPARMKDPRVVNVRLESHHLKLLAQYARQHGLIGRSAVLRHILDNYEFAS